MSTEDKQEMTIGEFYLVRDRSGYLWISREDGESMRLEEQGEEAFRKVIEQFWKENF